MDILTAKNNQVVLFLGEQVYQDEAGRTVGIKNGYKSIFISPEGFNIYQDVEVPADIKEHQYKFEDGVFTVNEAYEPQLPLEEKLEKLQSEKETLEGLLDDALSLLMETEIL